MDLYEDMHVSTVFQINVRVELLTVEEIPRQNACGVDGNEEIEAKRILASSGAAGTGFVAHQLRHVCGYVMNV